MAIALRELSQQPSGEGLRRVRTDALPEYTHYADDGCDIHPHCLTCPLPRCRYEEPGGLRALLNAYRDQQILALRRQGLPADAIAQRFHLSRRTVFRILAQRSKKVGGRRKGEGAPSFPLPSTPFLASGKGHRQGAIQIPLDRR